MVRCRYVYLKEMCLWEFSDDLQLTALHIERNKNGKAFIRAGYFDVGQS